MLFFGLLPDKEYGSIAFGLKELKEKLKTKLNSVCVCVCVCMCACMCVLHRLCPCRRFPMEVMPFGYNFKYPV